MDTSANTRYPIVLVHGLFGFDHIGPFNYFNGIKEALNKAGATVYVAKVSAANSSEERGEQLLEQLRALATQNGLQRFNVIGHSQGALTARYAAAIAPERVASVTSVSGPNQGSELADRVRQALTPGALPETVAAALSSALGSFISRLSGRRELPQDALGALNALTTEGVAAFNKKYPQGLPETWGAMGAEQVNGVLYYSWSGVIKGSLLSESLNIFDPLHNACRVFGSFFTRESKENDGMVGRFSSHLGQVIRSDYPLDHLDTINHVAALANKSVDPAGLYVEHARRLKAKGV